MIEGMETIYDGSAFVLGGGQRGYTYFSSVNPHPRFFHGSLTLIWNFILYMSRLCSRLCE